MTRLLLDENFPLSAVAILQQAGHDVDLVRNCAVGASDRAVLELCRQERRCLLTFDSDFGELVFHQGAESPPAIVFLRMNPIVPAEAAALALEALQDPLQGMFVVATAESIRRRPLPGAAPGDGSR